ncbi:hypothetical protein MMPV_001600 [Pyropia vietnamensis]
MALRSQMMALTLPTHMMRPNGCCYPSAACLDDEDAGSGEWDADLTPVVPSGSNGSSSSRSGLGPMPRKRMWSGPAGGVAVPRSRPVSMVFGASESSALDDVMPGGSYLGMDDALDEDEFDDYSSDEACPTAHLTRRSPQVSSPAIAIPRNDTGRPSAIASPIASGGSWVDGIGNDDVMEGEEADEPFVPPHLLSQRLTQSLAAVPRRDIRHALANWA